MSNDTGSAEMGSPEAIKSAVEAGLGISVVSGATVAKEVKLGTLVGREGDARPLYFFVHRNSSIVGWKCLKKNGRAPHDVLNEVNLAREFLLFLGARRVADLELEHEEELPDGAGAEAIQALSESQTRPLRRGIMRLSGLSPLTVLS